MKTWTQALNDGVTKTEITAYCTECDASIPNDAEELYNKLNVVMSVRVCKDCFKGNSTLNQ